ncbi:peptidase S51 [Romboutsia weinsteinii]|uniref:Peptidase S51 n=1 Tax=Romboutsia weinsteinii TaxID=2020949 RepID=A0A371J351_9FIRM|nr:Type 1 glutamine amidotransferase-like domain-containing protein [Romboutsia weinsteinii]RDY27107.1 peptidase S51 [Romboutsia weinsteinii]
MVNILLSLYNFDSDWCYDTLKDIIKSNYKVLIAPLSYHEEWLKDNYDWYNTFNPNNGSHYKDIVSPFLSYGITEDNIYWINQFEDSREIILDKIESSDIIFFTGGYPDKMMDRFINYGLVKALENYKGIMIGSSAGAMVQIADYHISQDHDYDEFSYNKGLNIIKDFDIEVHYEDSIIQNESIRRCIKERGKPIYSIENEGAVLVIDGKATMLGKVKKWLY